jgi:hypothetical protein
MGIRKIALPYGNIVRERPANSPRGGKPSRKRHSGRPWGAFMDHASSHNAFNVLFTLAFFATFALMIVRFG